MTALGLHITLPCIERCPSKTIAVLDCLKENNTRIGIVLQNRDDGRYHRFRYAALEELGPEEVEGATTKELYILDEEVEQSKDITTSRCAFKVESITIQGIPDSDVYMFTVYDTHQQGQKSTMKADAFCNRMVYLPSLDAAVFAIRLRSLNVTVLSGGFYGQCWLRVVLSDDALTRTEVMELTEDLCMGIPLSHLRDYAVACKGPLIRVEVRATKKLADWGMAKIPCWHFAILIRFGPGMLLSS